MEIIATTKGGCIISATEAEVKEILSAVNGTKPEKVEIGQKIPAIDYSSTIRKVKELKECYEFRNLVSNANSFTRAIEDLKEKVDAASKMEL